MLSKNVNSLGNAFFKHPPVGRVNRHFNNTLLANINNIESPRKVMMDGAQRHAGTALKPLYELKSPWLVKSVMENMEKSRKVMINGGQSHSCTVLKPLYEPQSPPQAGKVITGLQEGNDASPNKRANTSLTEAKSKDNLFIYEATNELMKLEQWVAENKRDPQGAFISVKVASDRLNSSLLKRVKSTEYKINSKLSEFKKYIINVHHVDGITKAQLKALENTANTLAHNMLSTAKGFTLN